MDEPTMTEHDCGCVTCPTHTEQPVPEAPADAFGNDPDKATREWTRG